MMEKRYIDANKFTLLLEKDKARFPGEGFYNRGVRTGLQRAIIGLSREADAPTENVREDVHAHWVLVNGDKGVCSHCHRQDGIDPLATHCRFCGARMDEEGE